jgi:GT2 family glycosyltransferase
MTTELSRPPLDSTIALVTVLYNCEKHLPLFFESLAQQTDRDFVVVIIDNASKDHSLERARELAATHGVSCHFVANEANLGIAVGNNQGIHWARAQNLMHIVLINNDISCEAELIAAIRLRAIKAGHRAWTCLAYLGDGDRRWYGGGRLSYWRARGLHYTQRQSEAIKAPTAVTYAPTCLMYLHASVFDTIGMMDPRYFVYYDDTDFCRRLNDANIALQYDPAISFRHYVGGSSGGESSEFFVRISTRNKFIYIFKHYTGVRRHLVTALAIVSKLAQLTVPRLRRATWLGLQDAFHGIH